MIITKRQVNENVRIAADGIEIEKVQLIKYLGIMIDDKLNLKKNTELVLKKMAKKTGFLMRNRKKVDTEAKLMLYKSIVAPHIDYCSSILYLCYSGEISDLQKIQNRALRAIYNESRYASIDVMLRNSNILDVKQRIYFNVLLLLYKAKNNLLPEYLCERLTYVRDAQPYTLRSNDRLRPSVLISAFSQNSVFYNGVIMINEMINQDYKVDRSDKICKE